MDPAHWVSVVGGAVMMTVVCLSAVALIAPWWTESNETPGKKEQAEVSLWVRYTRMELAADDSTLNCAEQCDFTKIGSAKIRESDVQWADACVEATETLATNCLLIWIVRVAVLFLWFFALLYAAFSTLNFCGAGFPSSLRIPAAAKIALAVCCLVSCLLALVIAGIMDIRLMPLAPGTEPRPTEKPPTQLGLNGIGFLCILASLALSLLGIAIAYFSQFILKNLAFLEDVEGQGRPLADVNKSAPPCIKHQAEIHKAVQVAPEPKVLGAWMAKDGPW